VGFWEPRSWREEAPPSHRAFARQPFVFLAKITTHITCSGVLSNTMTKAGDGREPSVCEGGVEGSCTAAAWGEKHSTRGVPLPDQYEKGLRVLRAATREIRRSMHETDINTYCDDSDCLHLLCRIALAEAAPRIRGSGDGRLGCGCGDVAWKIRNECGVAGANGTFGARGITIKAAIAGGSVAAGYLMSRRHRGTVGAATVANFGMAATYGYIAHRNTHFARLPGQ
jgi:hypothetical protein